MSSNEITKGNKLSMLTQLGSLLVLLGTIVLAWGKIDGRVTMAEHRIVQLEARTEAATSRRENDNLGLARLVGTVEVQNEKLQSLSDRFKRFEDRLDERLPREPPRR